MDTQDLEASLKQSQALIVQASQTVNAAKVALVNQGFATRETLDRQRQVLVSAIAGQNASTDVIGESQAALDAATHAADVFKANIADDSLVSPRDGRIEYRVANTGEVLAADGKVLTMLDTGYVYMDIYLPTISAGRVKLGTDDNDLEARLQNGSIEAGIEIPPGFGKDIKRGRSAWESATVDGAMPFDAQTIRGYLQAIHALYLADPAVSTTVPAPPLPANIVIRSKYNQNFDSIYAMVPSDIALMLALPQMGLLFMLVFMPMNMLSGSNTPLESMPVWLSTVMQASPSTHFVSFAQSILYRGAGISIVWPQFLVVALVGGLFFGLALWRFRSVAARTT